MRSRESHLDREENACSAVLPSHQLSPETAHFCGLFGPATGDEESRAGALWRRERGFEPAVLNDR
jgi:hypothetical protein